MKVIPPLTINDARLTSSTAAEPGAGEVAWSAATNYSLGTVVYLASTHRKYENLLAGVDATSPDAAPTRWLDVGSTNKWAMFDMLRNTGTTAASPLITVLTPGTRVNALAVLGSNAQQITVTITSGAETVYSRTENMVWRFTRSYYDYCFGPFYTRPSLILLDLPPYTNAVITVTMTHASADVVCGASVVGNAYYIGDVEYNAVSDALNFSEIDRDEFGNAVLTPRRNVPTTEQILWVDKSYTNIIRQLRKDLDAVPAVWSGLDDNVSSDFFEALLILGIYQQFSIDLDNYEKAKITLKLEEL